MWMKVPERERRQLDLDVVKSEHEGVKGQGANAGDHPVL